MQVRDPHVRRSLADESDFSASISDPDRSATSPIAISRKKAAAARTSARVIQAARALSAVAAAPVAATPSDPASTPNSSSSGKEGRRPDQSPPSAVHSVRAHPRRLVNFFPESALEPEKPSIAPLTAAAESPALLSPQPAPMLSDAAPPASSIDSASDVQEPFERARSELLAAIRAGGGPALLTGPAGVGKTTLCHTLVQGLDCQTVASVVSGAPQSFDDLLKVMLVGFGVMTAESSGAAHLAPSVLIRTLDSFLETLAMLHARAVVFIDDGHKIPAGVLAELAVMQTPGSPRARLLQLVLVGRPTLRSRLKRADLKTLDASIVLRTTLLPFRAHESAGDVTRPSAILNRAPTEPAAVHFSLEMPHSFSPAFKRLLLIAAVALMVLAGALWVWRDVVGRTIFQ